MLNIYLLKMGVNIEVYLNTENYSKDSLIESIEFHISSLNNLQSGDKITSEFLPSEVKFLRIETNFDESNPQIPENVSKNYSKHYNLSIP